MLSSIRMERNCILASLGSPAPTHVQQMTSAFWGRECARPQGTCRSRFPDPRGQAGQHTDTAVAHTLPDSIFNPGCGDTNSQDPTCLGVTPKEGCGASRQPLRGSAEPGKTESGRRCSGPAPAPGTDQAPTIPATGRLAGSGIYLKKACVSDNKLSLCDLRESTWRTVLQFSPQMEKNPLKALTWT